MMKEFLVAFLKSPLRGDLERLLMARSSSGLGHRLLKARITGSPEGTPLEESRTDKVDFVITLKCFTPIF